MKTGHFRIESERILPKEANIQKEADKLMEQLSLNEVIIRYKELEMKVQENHYLTQLTEEIQKHKKKQ